MAKEEKKEREPKGLRRIPRWAEHPNQYNHKIVKAYFAALDHTGVARRSTMEKLCGDKSRPEFYVPRFNGNFACMKSEKHNCHGKVFVQDGDVVKIWSEVEETLLRYKSHFYPEDKK